MKEDYVRSFEKDVYGLISKKEVIMRHHKKYINDKFAPAWKTIEYMSLGEVCMLYQNLKSVDDRLLISRCFGVNKTVVFENYQTYYFALLNEEQISKSNELKNG